MENSTTSMEYCTIFLQNNIPQNSHALSISVVHIMQHLSSLIKIRIFNAQNKEKNAMRREVNRADIGGKSGNKVKDCHVTIIRSLLSQIKENSLRVLLTYRKLFTINTKIAVEFIINSCIVYYKRSPYLL